MQWHYLDNEFEGLSSSLPDLAGTALVLAKIEDHRGELDALELAEIQTMAQRRQFEFASGRYCAHLAQKMVGLVPQPILRKNRVPLWPGSCIGSITHSDKIAGAAVSTSLGGIGLDIEAAGRVEEKLFRVLFSDTEKKQISASDFDAATVMFSAKEAGYKAIYPIGQKFIGFLEAEIVLHPADQTFTIRYLGDHPPNQALEGGYGFWREHQGQIMTVFVIE